MRNGTDKPGNLDPVLIRLSDVNAEKITRQSKSNLALGFVVLGRERRRDITIFYAFCRVIDDIADSPGFTVEEKARLLTEWRSFLRVTAESEPPIAADLRAVMKKYSLNPEMLDEIIAGVEMDLTKSEYATFEDLRVYCHRVASAVGLVSIEIFGYQNPACREYARAASGNASAAAPSAERRGCSRTPR